MILSSLATPETNCTGLVSSRVNITSWVSITLRYLFSCSWLFFSVTIKIPYDIDNLLHRPALHPIFTHFSESESSYPLMLNLFWVSQTWLVPVRIQEWLFSGCALSRDGKEIGLWSSDWEAPTPTGKNIAVILEPYQACKYFLAATLVVGIYPR